VTLTRRRGRAALLTAAVAFAAGEVVAAALAAHSPYFRDPLFADKAARLERCFTDDTGRPFRVLMLGSSRTAAGFHGRRLEAHLANTRPVRAFNFGIPAAGPVTNLVYLRRLLAAGTRPDLLLVEVMPPFLADRPDGPLEGRWTVTERFWRDEVADLVAHGFPAEPSWAGWRRSWLVPAYGMRFPVMGRVVPSSLPWSSRFDWSRGTDDRGWNAPDAPPPAPAEYARGVAQARAAYADTLADLRLGGPACRALEELLTLARDHGLPTTLVLMPEGDDFRAFYPPDADRRLASYLDGLAGRFGAGLVDARRWLPDSAFTDSHHLRAAGAVAFTDRLAREAVLPRLTDTGDRP
jgi:hypothetical protein